MGGRRSYRLKREIFEEINITPFTDVLLVLLIIFVITGSAMLPLGIEVAASAASSESAQPFSADDGLQVEIKKDGAILLLYNLKPIEWAQLSSLDKDVSVLVTAEDQVKFEAVLRVYEKILGLGFLQVGWGAPI